MGTKLQIVKKVLSEYTKIKPDVSGLCSFAAILETQKIITEKENNIFYKTIYSYRKRFVSPDRQDSMWFFPVFETAPRIEFMEKIIKDLESKKLQTVSKKSGKQKSSRRK